MTGTQLYLAIGVPVVFNAIAYALVFWRLSRRIRSIEAGIGEHHGSTRYTS